MDSVDRLGKQRGHAEFPDLGATGAILDLAGGSPTHRGGQRRSEEEPGSGSVLVVLEGVTPTNHLSASSCHLTRTTFDTKNEK